MALPLPDVGFAFEASPTTQRLGQTPSRWTDAQREIRESGIRPASCRTLQQDDDTVDDPSIAALAAARAHAYPYAVDISDLFTEDHASLTVDIAAPAPSGSIASAWIALGAAMCVGIGAAIALWTL